MKEIIQKTAYFPSKKPTQFNSAVECPIKSGPLTTNDEQFQEPHRKMDLQQHRELLWEMKTAPNELSHINESSQY